MATRFVELNDAAKMLGLTPDQLVEMRSNGAIHGYRDGASWKFKIEEIERVAAEKGGAKKAHSKDKDELLAFDSDAGLEKPAKTGRHADEDGSILVSEEELGLSSEGSSSTIIGKTDRGESRQRFEVEGRGGQRRGPGTGRRHGSDTRREPCRR